MTSFEEADNNGSGSIEKHEWDLLLLEDKRRRIEDEEGFITIRRQAQKN